MGGARRDVVDVMGDDDRRRRRRVARQVVEGVDELLAPAEVEARRRLVEEDDRRVVHQRAGEQHPLALAGRQRVERPLGEVGHPHPGEALAGPLVVGIGVAVPPRLEGGEAGGAHDVEHARRRAQQVGQRRRGVGHPPAQLTDVGAPESLAEHLDDTRRRVVVHRGDAQQRRLAAAVGPEHQPALTVAHDHRHVVEDEGRAPAHHDVVEVERNHSRERGSRRDRHSTAMSASLPARDSRPDDPFARRGALVRCRPRRRRTWCIRRRRRRRRRRGAGRAGDLGRP